MPAVSTTGTDTATINGTILATLADGNPFDITFPNELGVVKVGKNGNSIYAQNSMGLLADVVLRILVGGSDDKLLNALMQQWIASPTSFTLMTGIFVKNIGDGQGNIQSKVYNCTGGIFKNQVEMKTAAEGDTEQSVAVYMLRFAFCSVSIQ